MKKSKKTRLVYLVSAPNVSEEQLDVLKEQVRKAIENEIDMVVANYEFGVTVLEVPKS